MFPPGRGRLGTKPEATGSLAIATTGIVLVACFTASATITPGATITPLAVDHVGDQFAETLHAAASITIRDGDIYTFLITQLAQALLKAGQ